MKHYRQLLVIGDGIVYRCNGSCYVSGSSRLDIYDIFKGIEKVYIWNRIYDIPEEETEKYNCYDVSQSDKKIIFCGIDNQPAGYRGYLKTIKARYRQLDALLKEPTLVLFSPVSISQWMLWYCFKKRELIFIIRMIGDLELTGNYNKAVSQAIVWVRKRTLREIQKRARLQSWVSKELERKYRRGTVPSVVFHDCLMLNRDVSSEIRKRETSRLKLIFVGRLSPEKGIYDLLRAITEMSDLDISLNIVGGGTERQNLERKIKQNRLGEKAVLHGQVKWGEELFYEMRKSDCLVLPSYSEGLPMALLEAMGNGIPVIAARVGGIPEVVDDKMNGLLFEAGDVKALGQCIRRIYHDEAFRRKLAENALKTARENTREKQLEIFHKAYITYVYPALGDCVNTAGYEK